MALTFDAHPAHEVASQWMAGLRGRKRCLFCRATHQSFLRLVSTPALHKHYGVEGLTNQSVLALHKSIVTATLVGFHDEPAGVEVLWHQLAARPTASPKVWMDAYLAAFAIAAAVPLVTLDQDFQAYEKAGLKLVVLQVPGSPAKS